MGAVVSRPRRVPMTGAYPLPVRLARVLRESPAENRAESGVERPSVSPLLRSARLAPPRLPWPPARPPVPCDAGGYGVRAGTPSPPRASRQPGHSTRRPPPAPPASASLPRSGCSGATAGGGCCCNGPITVSQRRVPAVCAASSPRIAHEATSPAALTTSRVLFGDWRHTGVHRFCPAVWQGTERRNPRLATRGRCCEAGVGILDPVCWLVY
jgi:hypothetical protein